MKTNATKPRTYIDALEIPNGIYDGTWGGSIVRFGIDGETYEAETDYGIRTPSAFCTVTVLDGVITVKIGDGISRWGVGARQ